VLSEPVSAQAGREPARGEREMEPEPPAPPVAMRFKQALVRLHPRERRGVSLLIDPERVAPGTEVHIAVNHGLGIGRG
jgi:hypothetical protein